VLLAPARLEIVQALRCIGPCAVAELAAMVDRPADLLYRQLVLLEKAEFVTQAGTRKRGRHSERLYDVTADDFALGFRDLTDETSSRTLTQTVRTFCHAGAKEVEASIKAGAIKLGDGQNMVVNYELSWLTPEQFQDARALLYQVKQLLDAARPKRQGRPFVFVSVATPLTRRTKRKVSVPKGVKSKAPKTRVPVAPAK
jgi:predicted transcriptional regulator